MTALELMDSRKFMNCLHDLVKAFGHLVLPGGHDIPSDEKLAEALQAVLDMANGKQLVKTSGFAAPLNGPKLKRGLSEFVSTEGLVALKPEVAKASQIHTISDMIEAPKPKRKRRTKAEMQADTIALVETKADKAKKKVDLAEARRKFDEHSRKITPQDRLRFAAEDAKNAPADPIEVIRKAIREVIKPNWHKAVPNNAGYKIFNLKMNRDGQSVSFNPENWIQAMKSEGLHVTMNGQLALMNFRVLSVANRDIPGQARDAENGTQWMELQIA